MLKNSILPNNFKYKNDNAIINISISINKLLSFLIGCYDFISFSRDGAQFW